MHILVDREQRLDLFIKLGKWGMNSYLYAPKVSILRIFAAFCNESVISQAIK